MDQVDSNDTNRLDTALYPVEIPIYRAVHIEVTDDQRKLLIRENYYGRNKTITIIGFQTVPKTLGPITRLTFLLKSVCVLHRNAFLP